MVAGTHTHIPTSDARILSKGTGYISDVGMSGDYDSILGFDKQNPLEKFISGIPWSIYPSKRVRAHSLVYYLRQIVMV